MEHGTGEGKMELGRGGWSMGLGRVVEHGTGGWVEHGTGEGWVEHRTGEGGWSMGLGRGR